ncbi:uncharacterized protein LOC111331261 [Stylophora pistillata]|uniref:uncharacterized protein LOC111331261 n=1 Tax=Stylophora pistillata TaxID=50429 RepID=UPI000C0460C2|nr:uncharacterized protein LOC111331261 [Stylophora pistillata]
MKVLLQNKELWQRFRQHQTEMMITKSGRRMCPIISLKFEDLTPRQFYTVMIDFVLMDEYRYSFDTRTNTWVPYCRELPAEEGYAKVFVHPETPWNGATLMMNGLTFKTLKLTNSFKTAEKSPQAILLSTMRRYTPRIHVLESPNGIYFDYKLRKEFYFSEMEFMAVSQYRNKNITELKIDANPFASAYRRDGLHGQAKRRRMESQVTCGDERTSDDGPPSSSSSVQDFIVNGDELDKESNQSSSNEHPEESSLEESFIPNEKKALGINFFTPSQQGISKALPNVNSSTRAELNSQEQAGINSQEEILSNVSPVTQNQTQSETSDNESNLVCEESREWMWGFDHQMLARYEFENSIERSQRASHGPRLQNADYAKESFSDETKTRVSRRKKYVPRRLQRREDLSSLNTCSASKNEEETNEGEAVDIQNLNEESVKLSQPSNTHSDDDTIQSVSTRCSEEIERTPIARCGSHQPETVNSYVDAVLPSSVRTKSGVLFVIGQNASQSASSVADEQVAGVTSSSTRTEDLTGSSLDALIVLCSKAGMNTLGNRDLTEIINSQTVINASLEADEVVSSESSGSTLRKETEETSTDSSIRQLSEGSNSTSSISLTPQTVEQKTVGPCVVSMSSQYNGRASTSQATVSTFAVIKSSGSTIIADPINQTPKVTDVHRQSPTVTVECRGGATAVTTSCVEKPYPVIVETYSRSHVSNTSNRGQQLDRKQTRYKHIAPAPSKSINASFDEPACNAPVTSSDCNSGILYPTILDTFTLANFDGLNAAEKPDLYFIPPYNSPLPEVNQGYAFAPYRFGVTPVEKNFMQEFRLEKFYSFSSAREFVKSPVRPQARHYKTTRTNFSRLSLEPICSVIHPLKGSILPSLSDNSAISEVSAQKAWGWRS